MALPMTHLLCAHRYALLHARELLYIPEYYLGAIAPDAIHMREGSTPEDKRATHLFARGIRCAEKYMPLISDFLAEYKDAHAPLRAMAFGYGLHVVTDRIWVDFYCEECPELLDAQGQTQKEPYYNDTDQVDFLLWKKEQSRPFIESRLKSAEAHSIAGLTAVEIDSWRVRTLDRLENGISEHKGKIKYLTEERIKKFIMGSEVRLSAYMSPLLTGEELTV